MPLCAAWGRADPDGNGRNCHEPRAGQPASQFDVSERYALTAEIERLKGALTVVEAKLAGR